MYGSSNSQHLQLRTVLQMHEMRKSLQRNQLLPLPADKADEDDDQQLGDTMLAAYWAAVNSNDPA